MKNLMIIALILFVGVEHYDQILWTGYKIFKDITPSDYPKPHLAVGDCAAMLFVLDTTDGITGRVDMKPSCKVTDYQIKIVEVKKNSYVYQYVKEGGVENFKEETSIGHVDGDYVRVNCDGKYRD